MMELRIDIGEGVSYNNNLLPDQRRYRRAPKISRQRSGDFDSEVDGYSVVDNDISGDNKYNGAGSYNVSDEDGAQK